MRAEGYICFLLDVNLGQDIFLEVFYKLAPWRVESADGLHVSFVLQSQMDIVFLHHGRKLGSQHMEDMPVRTK